jgi:dienelactone hydrolase
MISLNSGHGPLCLVLCVLLGGCGTDSSATNPVAPSQTSSELIVESLADGSYRCHPAGRGPFPGILYNHGGLGTAVGGDLEGVCRSFAEIGYVAWCQRRPNSISLNGQLESVLEGFEALRAETNVDPNRLGILGFSRGGLLTLQAAISLGGAVRSIVLCAPAPGNGTLERTLVDAALIQASVRIYVAENDQQINGGTVTDHVALSQMVEISLKNAGKDVELTVYPPYADDGHTLFFEVREPWWSDVSGFFNQAL